MARDHGFHSVRITRIVQETPDTRTYVLDARPASPSPFSYRAGQFLTVRACGTLRSYSMSSSPDTDDELMVTVKRVAGGLVSNWMHDHLVPGDVVEEQQDFLARDVIPPLRCPRFQARRDVLNGHPRRHQQARQRIGRVDG